MKQVVLLAALFIPFTVCPNLKAETPSPAARAQAQRDQLHIAIQQICPISGKQLGTMGPPVKVKIGEEEMFLCCKACLKSKPNAKHWATIHANFAKAQQQCPVMKNKLPKKAKWTIVEGRIIYVCCPPCIKKIEADPKTYLKMLDDSYATFLKNTSATQ